MSSPCLRSATVNRCLRTVRNGGGSPLASEPTIPPSAPRHRVGDAANVPPPGYQRLRNCFPTGFGKRAARLSTGCQHSQSRRFEGGRRAENTLKMAFPCSVPGGPCCCRRGRWGCPSSKVASPLLYLLLSPINLWKRKRSRGPEQSHGGRWGRHPNRVHCGASA